MSNSFLSNNNQNTSKSFIGQYEGIQDQNGLIIEENYLDEKPTNNINIKNNSRLEFNAANTYGKHDIQMLN